MLTAHDLFKISHETNAEIVFYGDGTRDKDFYVVGFARDKSSLKQLKEFKGQTRDEVMQKSHEWLRDEFKVEVHALNDVEKLEKEVAELRSQVAALAAPAAVKESADAPTVSTVAASPPTVSEKKAKQTN